MLVASLGAVTCGFVLRTAATHATTCSASHHRIGGPRLAAATQLQQLASMTTLSIDTGDLNVIAEMAATGFITDATTNPLFVSQVV